VTALLVRQVVWVGTDGRGLGACGHRHATADEATLCPFEPERLPDVCAGLVREVRDPEYVTEGQRIHAAEQARRPQQLELALDAP
jgi:hypothetical protein